MGKISMGAVLLALGLILPNSASSDTANPNILLIIADDMGVDASHCYSVGERQAKMPNVEKLCASGLVFENAYAAPVCSPTRATMMTGKYGFRTGVGAAIPSDGAGRGLSIDEVSLFDVLAKTAYKSALVGKWHLASSEDGLNHPSKLGVSEYFGMYKGGVPSYFDWPAVENGKQVNVKNYATTELTDRAISWISKQKTPWFMWLAYNAPHTPFHLPPMHLHSAKNLPSDSSAISRNPLPYYNAMLEALDTEIGRLLGSLSADVRANTIIVFIGDNGTPGQVSRELYGPRRSKGSIYEGGTHVPFIVQGPGVVTGRTKALAHTVDLYTTIAAIAGAEVTTKDSQNFTPVLRGKAGKRTNVYVEHFSDRPGRPADVFGWAIRDGRYKLVAPQDQSQQLFDLESDPLEKNNLLSGVASQNSNAKADELRKAHSAILND